MSAHIQQVCDNHTVSWVDQSLMTTINNLAIVHRSPTSPRLCSIGFEQFERFIWIYMAHVSSSFQFQHLEMHLTLNSVNMSIHCLLVQELTFGKRFTFEQHVVPTTLFYSGSPQSYTKLGVLWKWRRWKWWRLFILSQLSRSTDAFLDRHTWMDLLLAASQLQTQCWSYFPSELLHGRKNQMSQETMDFKDEATWKHFLWSPICCNCIIEEFMLDQDFGFQSVQSVQSVQEQIPLKTPPVQIPRVMQRIIREAECQADSDEFARGRYQTVPWNVPAKLHQTWSALKMKKVKVIKPWAK